MSRLRQWLLCVAAIGALPLVAWAHNPDTSYARITIFTNAVEFKFTYDIITLLKIVDLDANKDDRLTQAELNTSTAAIQSYLRKRIFVEIDGGDAQLGDALNATWPEDAVNGIEKKEFHQRLISFSFRLPVSRLPHDIALIFDVFGEFGDRHNVLGVFVHGNQEDPVIFTRFEPDYLYDLAYSPTTPVTNGSPPINTKPSKPAPKRSSKDDSLLLQMRKFLLVGMDHIFLGYDHILFLLGLIVIGRFWDLVQIVTSFTVAHTITLILAATRIVSLPPRLVETAIALTIVYVAAENIWKKEPKHRWRLTFTFGLIHGFGFANSLRGMELPATGFIRCLVSFNAGVELGQLIIVLLLWPVITWINARIWAERAKCALSVSILAVGSAWFIDRAFALGFMPF